MSELDQELSALGAELSSLIAKAASLQARIASMTRTAESGPKRLSIPAAADYLEVSTSSMYRIVKAGTIPVMRDHDGGHRKILVADLDAYLDGTLRKSA